MGCASGDGGGQIAGVGGVAVVDGCEGEDVRVVGVGGREDIGGDPVMGAGEGAEDAEEVVDAGVRVGGVGKGESSLEELGV